MLINIENRLKHSQNWKFPNMYRIQNKLVQTHLSSSKENYFNNIEDHDDECKNINQLGQTMINQKFFNESRAETKIEQSDSLF